jgi:hypothetical protein
MTSTRALLCTAPFAAILAVMAMITPTPAASAQAKFCIMRFGGGEGGAAGYTDFCIYSDYQQCLQAAVEKRGNCVQNIDYHGDAPASQLATAPRRRAAR